MTGELEARLSAFPAVIRVDWLKPGTNARQLRREIMEYAGSSLEIKQLDDSGHIEGLLAGFGNVDSHGDVINAKAFTRSLTERGARPLPMLLYHDLQRPVGAWKQWEERSAGLFVKGTISLATRDGKEAHVFAKDGALSGLSIGYRTKRSQVDKSTGENHLLEIDLIEGSLVTVPSNPTTHVSAVKALTGPADITDFLRARGLSGRKAKAVACQAWQSINGASDDAEAEAEIKAILDAEAEAEDKAILDASAKRIAALNRPAPTFHTSFNWS